MTGDNDAGRILRQMWDRIDAQDWDGMAKLFDPHLRASYVHTGEVFDASALVSVNRDYPGRWHVTVEDLVASGGRAVSRARVSDGTETYHRARSRPYAPARWWSWSRCGPAV